MRILSVNVAKPKAASYQGRKFVTGIDKKPLARRVWIRKTNIDGDKQADPKRHGGIDKAVYAFPFEHYAFYHEHLGGDHPEHGGFGENLTTEGMLESTVHVGDRFLIGTAIVEASEPRLPCFKLAMKMGNPDVVKLMVDSAKTGFYLRVIQEGMIAPGEVKRVLLNKSAPSIEEIHNLMFVDIIRVDGLKQALSSTALGQTLQQEFSKRLAKLTAVPE